MTNKMPEKDVFLPWKIAACFMVASLVSVNAYAVQDIGDFVCDEAQAMILGGISRGIGTIGIAVVGIGALLGKVTWTQALIVGVGCSVLFGAPSIIHGLGWNNDGTATALCNNPN